jgi:hypothetical protein
MIASSGPKRASKMPAFASKQLQKQKLVFHSFLFIFKHLFSSSTLPSRLPRIQNCILFAMEGGDLLLQSLVNILCAANETNGTQSETVIVHVFLAGVDEIFVVGKTKIIVGAVKW